MLRRSMASSVAFLVDTDTLQLQASNLHLPSHHEPLHLLTIMRRNKVTECHLAVQLHLEEILNLQRWMLSTLTGEIHGVTICVIWELQMI